MSWRGLNVEEHDGQMAKQKEGAEHSGSRAEIGRPHTPEPMSLGTTYSSDYEDMARSPRTATICRNANKLFQ